MAAPASPSGAGYPFPTYHGDYHYTHHPPPPHMPHSAHSHPGYAMVHQHHHVGSPLDTAYPPHMTMMQNGPPLPASPTLQHASQNAASPHSDKLLRNLLSAMTKLQSVMNHVAEKQSEILVRLNMLEQKAGRIDEHVCRVDEHVVHVDESVSRIDRQIGRVGGQLNHLAESVAKVDEQFSRVDDQLMKVDEQLLKSDETRVEANETLGRILEQVEMTAEDSRRIRARVDDNESQDAFEKRFTALMNGVVEKMIGGLGSEIKDIKKVVMETEKHIKHDPFAWNGKHQYMGQRYRDSIALSEEEQKEVHV